MQRQLTVIALLVIGAGIVSTLHGQNERQAETQQQLRKALVESARNAYQTIERKREKGAGTEREVYEWSLRLANAEARGASRHEKVQSYARHLNHMKRLLYSNAGEAARRQTQYYVSEAQLLLADANQAADK